jgi:hypothetical protein
MKGFTLLLASLCLALIAPSAPAGYPEGQEPTSLSIFLSTAIGRLQVGGDLTPDHFGDTIVVTRYKRENGAWKRLASKEVEMKDFGTAGDFVTTFALRNGGRCKIKAAFAGDDDHLPTTAALRYRCDGEGLEGPARHR